MTYWALNVVFLVPVIVLAVLGARRVRWAAVSVTMAVLLVMTAVFDNVMISVGLVAYDPSRISGAFVGVAPLEDFAYAVAAVLGLPALWHLLTRRHDRAARVARGPEASPPSASSAPASSAPTAEAQP